MIKIYHTKLHVSKKLLINSLARLTLSMSMSEHFDFTFWSISIFVRYKIFLWIRKFMHMFSQLLRVFSFNSHVHIILNFYVNKIWSNGSNMLSMNLPYFSFTDILRFSINSKTDYYWEDDTDT